MDIISAPISADHIIASTILFIAPCPSPSRALTGMIFAFGATPAIPKLFFSPAIVPEQ